MQRRLIRTFINLVAITALVGCGGVETATPTHSHNTDFSNPPGSPAQEGGVLALSKFIVSHIFDRGQPPLPNGHMLTKAEIQQGLQRYGDEDSVTWIGHATTLLHLGGQWIVTDPFFSNHASPLTPFGPKRFAPPALNLDELPLVTIMTVSHNHYDHLDEATIRAWPNKDQVVVVVPLNLGNFFRQRGYRDVRELAWWQSTNIGDVTVTATPAIHYSRRGLFDRNNTLWAGFVYATDTRKVFFAGDTAYGPVFRSIGERLGPFDLALLPIGAYEPQSHMHSRHVTPEEAVSIARDIRARSAIGIHWGTIVLTAEAPFEPPLRFEHAMMSTGFNNSSGAIMAIGETRSLSAAALVKNDD